MTLQNAEKLAINLIHEHGLHLMGWGFAYSASSKAFGACLYRKKLIVLSQPYTRLNRPELVRDAILHEIAHALVLFSKDHNCHWQATARRIGCNGRSKITAEVIWP